MWASKVSKSEASFTKLFTHETWKRHTGVVPLLRWWRISKSWPMSTILFAVLPVSAIASFWAYLVACMPMALLPRTSPIPMSLMGTALGLLLVFRTNNSYSRLNEARTLWSHLISLCREVAQGVATALLFDERVLDRQGVRKSAARVCRYLAAFPFELAAKLTGGPIAKDMGVLRALLPRAEAEWIGGERSRPLQLLAAIRRELHWQYRDGNLPRHVHRKLEEDVSTASPPHPAVPAMAAHPP